MTELATNTDVLDRADEIMDQAVEKAGDFLQERPLSAEVILRQLMKIDPEHLGGLQMLGLVKHRLGQNAEAIEIIQTALDLDPTNADNWNNMGLAYGGLGNCEKSVQCLRTALEYKPTHFMYMNNLALQLRGQDKHEEAVEVLKEALSIDLAPQMLINLGGIYGEMKKYEQAAECFSKAIEIDPKYSPAHVDLGFIHALKGEWEETFEEYEWRFSHYPQLSYYLDQYDQEKRWCGQDLQDKTILLYSEQGVGDGIQFIRYAKQLKERGATVLVHCAPSLNNLFERLEFVDKVVNRNIVEGTGEELPEYDYQSPIMSLPLVLNDFNVSGEPYITPATDKFRSYLEEEHGKGTFNVGIVWAGSPAHPHDKLRSIPLRHFKALEGVDNVKLFSLQVDTRKRVYGTITHPEACNNESDFQSTDELVDYCEGGEDMKLIDLTTIIQDFEDTATVIGGLDLIICCDTAVVHLAGAMGVPAWILLPYNPDWRWCAEGETTDWYDSVRLFRQKEKYNWEQVFEEVREALNETVLQNQ